MSLGCPKNRVDSEGMLALLTRRGYLFARDPTQADVIIINTCAFIREAVEESVDEVLDALNRKEECDGRKVVVVAGCLTQRYGEMLAASFPEVDLLIGCRDMERIDQLLERGHHKRLVMSRKGFFLPDSSCVRTPSLGPHTAYVKALDGCNRRCAFCTIPSIKGRQRSRPVGDLVLEVTDLVRRGVKEIVLVGQDLTSYGRDLLPSDSFVNLLEALDTIDELSWLRTLYLYPSEVTARLLEIMVEMRSIVPYLDLPIQHVDTKVLSAMHRGYDERNVRSLMRRVRKIWPSAFVRVTLMVGHPAETESAFRSLMEFVETYQPDHMGVFAYSKEEGTPSARMRNATTLKAAAERRQKLMSLQNELLLVKQKKLIGKTICVLVDGPSHQHPGIFEGRHVGQAPEIDGVVYIALDPEDPAPPPSLAPGSWVRIRVEQATSYDLAGPVIEVLPSCPPRQPVRCGEV